MCKDRAYSRIHTFQIVALIQCLRSQPLWQSQDASAPPTQPVQQSPDSLVFNDHLRGIRSAAANVIECVKTSLLITEAGGMLVCNSLHTSASLQRACSRRCCCQSAAGPLYQQSRHRISSAQAQYGISCAASKHGDPAAAALSSGVALQRRGACSGARSSTGRPRRAAAAGAALRENPQNVPEVEVVPAPELTARQAVEAQLQVRAAQHAPPRPAPATRPRIRIKPGAARREGGGAAAPSRCRDPAFPSRFRANVPGRAGTLDAARTATRWHRRAVAAGCMSAATWRRRARRSWDFCLVSRGAYNPSRAALGPKRAAPSWPPFIAYPHAAPRHARRLSNRTTCRGERRCGGPRRCCATVRLLHCVLTVAACDRSLQAACQCN
jgi:hypothetical protein